MKKCAAFCILILLVFQNISSLWIIGDFYINQDFIAKNICINRFDAIPVCRGQCYLARELKKEGRQQQQQQQIPSVTYKEIQLFCEALNIFEPAKPAPAIRTVYPLIKIIKPALSFVFSIDHPPRRAKRPF